MNDLTTIDAKDQNVKDNFGQRTWLHFGNVKAVNLVYCNGKCMNRNLENNRFKMPQPFDCMPGLIKA